MKQRASYDAGVRCYICCCYIGTVKYGTVVTMGRLVRDKIDYHEQTVEHKLKLASFERERAKDPFWKRARLRRIK